MYHRDLIEKLVTFIQSQNGIGDKRALAHLVQQAFGLTKDRSVYYGRHFAVRFCTAAHKSFSNTVLSLSALQKYDAKPFIVCLVTPQENHLLLANATFLRKISHSSQALRSDNIKGSFNGSDILRQFDGKANAPENFAYLFTSHENYTFEENLIRLVEATNHIVPIGQRFSPSDAQLSCIRQSVARACDFFASKEYQILHDDLQSRVEVVSSEIVIAAFIDNVNLRGRIIEYLITSADTLRAALIRSLHNGTPLPKIYTADRLGDYERDFARFRTATDIKTKVMFLSSNPKGYSIDKLLSFLSTENSVYLIYIVAIDENRKIITRLCSMYHCQILQGTRLIGHWAGRNTRGVTQYDGRALREAVLHFDNCIDRRMADAFLTRCLSNAPFP